MFGVIKRNPTLSIQDLCRALMAQDNDSDIYESGAFSYTGYARFALYNILKLLKLDHGSEVLLPAYVCDVVLLPFPELGLKPVYYGITDQFQIDFGTTRLSKKSRAIITVNYFGMSQDFNAIKSFAVDNQLIWINDNSHGFASSHGENKLESFGDFSITSFRKVLPIINGARARINNEAFKYMSAELSALNRPDATESKLLRFLGASLLGNLHYRPWKHPDYADLSASLITEIMPYRFDTLSCRVLRLAEEGYVQKRRFNLYQAIDAFFLRKHYKFIETIPNLLHPGNSPMAYPVVINDQCYRRAILSASRDSGIDIHPWPDLPKEVFTSNVFGSVEMWQRLLFFPIQQDLDAQQYCQRLAEMLDSMPL